MAAILLSTLSFAAFAQNNDVTKFLGIPIDGTKSEMIQKLKAKGYTYDSTNDCLKGEFNGRDADIYVATNNNRVYRIMVADAKPTSEADIKIRFNNLCYQFENNERYMPANLKGFSLSDDEDISYEISVHNKRYEASYYQLPSDTATFNKAYREDVASAVARKYPQERINNASDTEREEMIEGAQRIGYDLLIDKWSKKLVWFMINDLYGKYYISIFYDNVYNQANGEDL